jgi:predicted nucleic acid-binding protein
LRTALDTNVLSALWSGEPSARGIESILFDARSQGGLVICAPVYCELLAYPSATRSFVQEFLSETGIFVDFLLDEQVWQSAANAFVAYAHRRRRSRGGPPKRMLVDFVVAAHAVLRADQLMTLRASRYRPDFTRLRIVRS